MCGIVGLQLRQPSLRPELGRLFEPMLEAMSGRGPDSFGIAWFDPPAGSRVSLLVETAVDWPTVAEELERCLGSEVEIEAHGGGAVVTASPPVAVVEAAVRSVLDDVVVVGTGRTIGVTKHVGDVATWEGRRQLALRSGVAAVGHTRMATESAVRVAASHPFSTGPDMALVHNGSFSNYASVRRDLVAAGVQFDSDNDTEVCARLVSKELASGASLEEAMHAVVDVMDGFYTLLVATDRELAVLRDAIGCKPAVIAETDDYVAMASEYHALAHLPGIESARVFEPDPLEVYRWKL